MPLESSDRNVSILAGKTAEALMNFLPSSLSPATPYVGFLVESIVKYGQERWLRWERSLTVAAQNTGVTPEQLLQRLDADPVHQELLARVLEASGRAVYPGKIDALGRVLSRGITDDRVDESLIIAAALADMEGPHVQVLDCLGRHGDAMLTSLIQSNLPGHVLVLPALLSTLGRHGLIHSSLTPAATPDPADPGVFVLNDQKAEWSITSLGRELLALLKS